MRSALALARSRAARGVSSHRTVAGQAMVLGLALILVLCIGIVLLFNTGQVVNKKVELVNDFVNSLDRCCGIRKILSYSRKKFSFHSGRKENFYV